jgi:hypothetical protein
MESGPADKRVNFVFVAESFRMNQYLYSGNQDSGSFLRTQEEYRDAMRAGDTRKALARGTRQYHEHRLPAKYCIGKNRQHKFSLFPHA